MARHKMSAVVVGLYVTTVRDSGYFHVRARPVIIGPNAEDEQGTNAPSVNAERITNPSSSYGELVNGLDLDSLLVNSQGEDAKGTSRSLYGWAVEYRDIFSVDARRAKNMHTTLRAIEKRMEAIYAKHGNAATFGQYVARVAHAIGATKFVFPIDKSVRFYDDARHRIANIADGIYSVDRIVAEWVEEGQAVSA